jgi:hypothetical protein
LTLSRQREFQHNRNTVFAVREGKLLKNPFLYIMKRMTLILILLIPFTVMAQTGTGPYTKTKNFPPINLLLPDSSTI